MDSAIQLLNKWGQSYSGSNPPNPTQLLSLNPLFPSPSLPFPPLTFSQDGVKSDEKVCFLRYFLTRSHFTGIHTIKNIGKLHAFTDPR